MAASCARWQATAQALLADAARGRASLHGDLHHDNVLDFGPRGWLAIDPHGLLGERGFDFANIFDHEDGSSDGLSWDITLTPSRVVRPGRGHVHLVVRAVHVVFAPGRQDRPRNTP